MPADRTTITLDTELLAHVRAESERRDTTTEATLDDLVALILVELEMSRGPDEERGG